MLQERAVGESLWEAVLPEELCLLPPELAKLGAALDDDRFLAPFPFAPDLPGFTAACFEGGRAADLLASHPARAADIERMSVPAGEPSSMPEGFQS